MSRNHVRKVIGDTVATVIVLGVVFCLVGSVALHGLADTINAIGAATRSVFGG